MSKISSTIETVSINVLIPFERNPRRHDQRSIDAIEASIRRFGFTNPILVRRADNTVIAGHGRLEAAKRQGLSEVPVIYLDFDEAEAMAYNIADNRTSDLSTFDDSLLKGLLSELDAIDINLDGIGFTQAEIDKMLEAPNISLDDDHEKQDPTPKHTCPKCGFNW